MSGVLKTVEDEWNGYAAMVYHGCPDISDVQKKESRQAFYAGALAAVTMFSIIGEQDDITEDQGVAHMMAIREECFAFQRELLRRYSETN